jgi:hypothetical protein
MCPDICCQGSIFIRENRSRRKERTGARLRLPAQLELLGTAHRPQVRTVVQRLAGRCQRRWRSDAGVCRRYRPSRCSLTAEARASTGAQGKWIRRRLSRGVLRQLITRALCLAE